MTRDQLRAFDAARAASRVYGCKIRVYAVEVSANAWGQSRAYYVDQLPPVGEDVVQAWDVDEKGVTELPV